MEPAAEGVSVTLQRLDGSTWKAVGSPATTGADGKAEIQFPLEGIPHGRPAATFSWSRPVRDPALTSNTIQFMPGPTELGKNVLRVDVDKGVFPTTKGPEYEGVATLSTDGNVFLNRVALENFGVRGSTAEYPQEAVQAEVRQEPEDHRRLRHAGGARTGPSWRPSSTGPSCATRSGSTSAAA